MNFSVLNREICFSYTKSAKSSERRLLIVLEENEDYIKGIDSRQISEEEYTRFIYHDKVHPGEPFEFSEESMIYFRTFKCNGVTDPILLDHHLINLSMVALLESTKLVTSLLSATRISC